MMNEGDVQATRRLALWLGVTAVATVASLATYFVVSGPFGTLNDLGNALIAVLIAVLAWRLRHVLTDRSRAFALGCAVSGAAVAVIGSALVISGTTGFFLAMQVSVLGYAGIGAWLLVLNRSPGTRAWRRIVRVLGVSAGTLMTLGVMAAPGILLGFNDAETAPAWTWFATTAWLGIYVVLPAWVVGLMTLGNRRTTFDPMPVAAEN